MQEKKQNNSNNKLLTLIKTNSTIINNRWYYKKKYPKVTEIEISIFGVIKKIGHFLVTNHKYH